jgi:peptide/nickel transport system substrate-binding protein
MKLVTAVVGICAGAVVITACSSSKGHDTTGSKVIDGGTFSFAMNADPGNLDPQGSASGNLFQFSYFAYDRLLNEDAKGKVLSGLATSWQVSGHTVTLTLHKAITCSDGASFTVTEAAANLNYVADPKNKSPFLGVFVPAGAHASADASAGTVTLTTPQAAPFVLDGLANLPMVCGKGLQDRKTLARSTDGTGPYQLTQAAPGDHYTFTKRTGYTWGPDGADTATKGLPDKVIIKIIASETTAANLLLSGDLNAAAIVGPDTTRLQSAKLFSAEAAELWGEMWFNHAAGRVGADKPVRLALTQALDLAQLEKVLTSGNGTPATELAASQPAGCPGNSVADALPAHDLDAAKHLLEADGWTVGSGGVRSKGGKQLAVTFVYNTAGGVGGSAAAELAASAWKQLGVKVTTKAQDEVAIGTTVFSTGDFDVLWEPVNVSTPDQLVPFLSGEAPPNGTNFAHIDNAAYNAAVAKAATKNGTAGCADWLSAESNLVRDADVIPFANKVLKTFGSGARFEIATELVPTSIRMLAR